MNNKFFSFTSMLLLATSCALAQHKPFTIIGNIEGKTGEFIYLSYGDGDRYTTDSSIIKNGKFSFEGNLSGPTQAAVLMERNARSFNKFTQLYLVPGDMELSMDYNKFNEAKLKGSFVQDQAEELVKAKAPTMEKLMPLLAAYDKANSIYIDAMKANKDEATLATLKEAANNAKDAMDPLRERMNEFDIDFMNKYPSSFVTASMLRYSVSGMKPEEGETRYNKLSDEIKNSNLGRTIKKEIDELRSGSPGAIASNFTSTELRGGKLSLSDYRGKYVLLDFWASWCVPCRKGNPHLLDLYAKYKNKGFEILGVASDDGREDKWKAAVEEDNISVWKHVLRGYDQQKQMRGEKNENDISRNYGIATLPTKILVDPNGLIIGRYGGGGEDDDAMDKKLAEIFGK